MFMRWEGCKKREKIRSNISDPPVLRPFIPLPLFLTLTSVTSLERNKIFHRVCLFVFQEQLTTDMQAHPDDGSWKEIDDYSCLSLQVGPAPTGKTQTFYTCHFYIEFSQL